MIKLSADKCLVRHVKTVPKFIWADDVDVVTAEQINNISALPFVHHHVAIMADAHLGIGCTIGSVIPMKKAIVPATVGVDIGCGMMAVKTNWTADKLPDNLAVIRQAIERTIPLGMGPGHQNAPDIIGDNSKAQNSTFTSQSRLNWFFKQSDPESMWDIKAKNWMSQMGSLGSGNHFIEICLDEKDIVWVMLHSGSRGVGNAIGRKFIDKAKEDLAIRHIELPDNNLAWLSEGTQDFNDYIDAVEWAQEYATLNRRVMMQLIFGELEYYLPGVRAEGMVVNCHHNYVTQENHYGENVYITRKGAIRARMGDLGIIPGSMGTRSFIVRGKGNKESFNSCSHGAGRKMSRKQAKREFTMADLDSQTAGVELRRREAILDEIPGSYKDIDHVMSLQTDLVDVVHTLKQVLAVKGD